MRVVITGAGQVGCHAAAELVRGGDEVVLMDVHPDRPYVWQVVGKGTPLVKESVNDAAVLASLFERERAEAVVHTAALICGACSSGRPECGTQSIGPPCCPRRAGRS